MRWPGRHLDCFTSIFRIFLHPYPLVILTLLFRLFFICIACSACEVWITVQQSLIFGSIRLIFSHVSLLFSLHSDYSYFAYHISRKLDVACGCTTRSSPREVSFYVAAPQTIRTQTALSIYKRCASNSPQDRFKRCRSSDTRNISSLRFFAASYIQLNCI